MFTHAERIEFLKHPYSNKRAIRKIERIKNKLRIINKKFARPGDYIQSKMGFKNKVGEFVKVPDTYIFSLTANGLEAMKGLDEFVFKPNHLSRGIGIRVLERDNGNFVDICGAKLTYDELVKEAEAILKIKRSPKAIRGILVEERIRSHPDFGYNGDGMVDVRMVYVNKEFSFGVCRVPSGGSRGYGNTGRGAKWGVFMDNGAFVGKDDRFLNGGLDWGSLPFFNEMDKEGGKVVGLYNFPLQTVDMTVNRDGEVVVIESERLPQIEVYLTHNGGKWLNEEIFRN